MAQINLPFEKLLTPQGLSELKTLLDQAIANPADTVKVVFPHLLDDLDQPFEFPVDVTKTASYIFKESIAATNAEKQFFLQTLNSAITEFEIKLNAAGNAIEELKLKAETELNTIKNKLDDELAKIPYEIQIRDNAGNNEFFINQTEEIEGKVQGVDVKLKSSSCTFTSASMSQLQLSVEVVLPGITDETGNPHKTELDIEFAANRFTGTASNIPAARIQGLSATINQLAIVIENNEFKTGTLVNGDVVFDFLDQVNGNPGKIAFNVELQNNGDVLYEAQNPQGQELKKGSISVFFEQIRVLTHTNSPADVNINGWAQLPGVVNATDGLPARTTFNFAFADPHFEFTGTNFTPIPLGFGNVTFNSVFLRIHKNGNLVESTWDGNLGLPMFNNGQLDFNVNFIDAATDRLQIEVSNPQNNPIQHGDFKLRISNYNMLYENGVLQNIDGNGELEIPVVTSGTPIQVEFDYAKNGNDEEVRILANNFGTPVLGGCELTFGKIEFQFTNGTFTESSILGRVKIPDTTDGAGIAFELDITNQGSDYTITLDGTAVDNELNLGPVKLAVDAFEIAVSNGNLNTINGSGNMQLPGLSQAFAFNFNVDTSGNNPIYNINITNVVAEISGFNLTFDTISISSQANQQFTAAAAGSLELPVFQDGGALNFDVTFERNNNYQIAVSAGPEFVKFGDFELKNVALSLDVQAGVLQDFTGSGQLQIPGFNSLTAVSVAYTEANTQYIIQASNAIDLEMAGCALHLASFELEILNGNFEDCAASGTIKLPDATGTAGIQFSIAVADDGRSYSIDLTGDPADNKLEFGPVVLEFASFSLSVVNGDVESVSGAGKLKLPGFTDAFDFNIATDLSGPQALYIILIENVNADFESFNLHFNKIRIETKANNAFSTDIEGNLALPIFDVGQINFEVAVSENTTYTIAIDGTGQVAKFGDVELRDAKFDIAVDNGIVQETTGSASIHIPQLTDTNSPFEVGVEYKKAATEDLKISASSFPTVDFSVFQLTVSNLEFLVRDGSLQTSAVSGSATMPFFTEGNGNLSFSFSFNADGSEYAAAISSTGTLSFSGLEMKDIALSVEVVNKNLEDITGTASFKLPSADAFTTLSASYNGPADRLTLGLESPPPIDIAGLHFNFEHFSLSLISGSLESTSFDGDIVIDALDSPNNKLTFNYDLSSPGNYKVEINKGATETELKIGDVSLFVNEIIANITNGNLADFSASAGLSFPAFEDENNPGTPAVIDVSYAYTKADGKHNISVSGAPKIKIGGFGLTINTLTIAFTQSSLAYPFIFDGDLEIPGLTDSNDNQVVVGAHFEIEEGGDFTGAITGNASFDIGSAQVTITTLSLTKVGDVYEVKLNGTLELTEFSGMGGDAAIIAVEIEIASDGSFSILGEAPQGNGIKVADIPSVVRIYLSKLGLSRSVSNDWDFTIGGLIENLIVIPGMDDLLPNQLNIKELQVGNSFDLDLDIRWPSGLSISFGGAQSEAIIPVNGKFGSAVSLDALKITFKDNGTAGADLGVAFSGATLMLGPLTAVVEGLGIEAKLTKPAIVNGKPAAGANFGIVNIDIEFKPPTGLGVSIDTPVFTGGGFLFFDDEKGEYAGALELSFMSMFAISAIGVINSKMPDGKPGTSVLVIISVEFSPGIALGFGFFISGLGGMLGIHRTMQVERLRDGVRQGTIQNILFPKNIIQNITRIISDIKEVFPVKRDQFIIGPMAAITWGVPTIVRIDIGLAIEFDNPVRFAILGVLRVILPDESTSLIKIQVAFLGVLDLDKGMLSFDASLFDSKVLTFGLEGDMVLRLSWGEKKDFVISVGGFHPSFTPPTYLQIPTMKRLTLKILSGNPRLTLTSYFAITTNTVQFGAGIDFYFGIAGFKIIGEFGFDVLFQFSPFRFIADARARLAVKAGSATLFSISLSFTLEGPTPWRARGTAKFKILFFTVKANFDTTWGDKRDTALPDISVLPLIIEALEDRNNWRSITQNTHIDGMRMAPIATDEDDLILTPNGSIEILQKVVPLRAEISKFGQFKPADYTKFEFSTVKIGTTSVSFNYEQDVFAPANFLDINDKDKLALPSFEKQDAGIQLSGNSDMKAGSVKDREVEYEQKVMDELPNSNAFGVFEIPDNYRFGQKESTFFSRTGAVGATGLASKKSRIVNPNKVVLKTQTYAVVDKDNLGVVQNAQSLNFMQAQEIISNSGSAAQNIQIVTEDVLSL